jgi:hypothetical protein
MIQRGEGLRFAFESRRPFRTVGDGFRQEFERDASSQPRIDRFVHVAHTARSQMGSDAVVGDALADHALA